MKTSPRLFLLGTRLLQYHYTQEQKRLNGWKMKKKVVLKYFGNMKSLSKLPVLSKCKKLLNKNSPIFKNRTAEQLKTWIDNQRSADNRRKASSKLL